MTIESDGSGAAAPRPRRGRRPRYVRRSWYWRQPREFRRDHAGCCIGNEYCPMCRDPDPDCMDRCGCYAKDPNTWRKEMWARQVETDPTLAFIEPPAGPLNPKSHPEQP